MTHTFPQPTIDIGTLIDTNPDIHDGCPIVAGTGATVRRIALWYRQGLAPEAIADRIPHLSLAQIFAALTFYYANRSAIDTDLENELAEGDRLEALHREAFS